MSVEIVERNGRLIVSTPFNLGWKLWASKHGGKWDPGSRAWTFPLDHRCLVETALEAIFDEDGES